MGKSLGKGPISPTKVSSLLLLRLRQLLSQDLLHALLLLDEEGAHDALAHAAPWCEPGDNVGPKMQGSSTWGTSIGSESCQKILHIPSRIVIIITIIVIGPCGSCTKNFGPVPRPSKAIKGHQFNFRICPSLSMARWFGAAATLHTSYYFI